MSFYLRSEEGADTPLRGELGMDRLVHHVCTATGHQQIGLFDSTSPWSPNTLTFFEGSWAYCPAGERDGHEWRSVQAKPYADVREEIEGRIRSST